MKGLGYARYDLTQVGNIFGFSHLKEKHRIIYDSDKEDAFLVNTKSGITRFKENPEGIYASKTPIIYLKMWPKR